ncbi:MAG: trypsin-like peptidase domain-containing protein [Ruminococcus sp.]|nr:trypsin-like peptidase domain-containing protein [Ruminococcus sp.]
MNVFVSSGKKLVSAFVAVLMLVLSVTSYASMEVSAVNTRKTYKAFDADSGAALYSYYLDTNPYEQNTREVIGEEDSREVDNTLSGVVKINVYDGYSTSYGTGFVVDDHTIATAAHVVFDYDSDGTLQNTGCSISSILLYDVHGNLAQEILIEDIYEVHVPVEYINIATADHDDLSRHNYDYALITVGVDLTDYANFNFGIMRDEIINRAGDETKDIFCTGFPPGWYGQKATGSGDITSVEDRIFVHDIDAEDGQSGSPIYVITRYDGNTYYTVIGMHVATIYKYTIDEEGNIVYEYQYNDRGFLDLVPEANKGVRMTTELLHFYKNNPNAV